jgi:DeoR/GlpR family transcriptional regulator of sugar metabolism/ABC-type sugar transport system substrate-binding protein
MIKAEREARIVSLVNEVGVASIHDLVARLGRVSEVTIRRDVARLAAEGALRRSHGGVSRIGGASDKTAARSSSVAEDVGLPIDDTDAIVLPPLEGKGAETLRLMARRRRIPFLAESAPQAGGTYLGSDNVAAGRDLGEAAARHLAGKIKKARVLVVSLEALPNTRARCDGFLAGFADAFDGEVRHWRVDGRGIFRSALRASLDALQAHPDINVLFGVNDHSILAAIEAANRLGLDRVSGFSVGGEGGAVFDALVAGGNLVACCALFPELVGQRAVDVLSTALDGGAMPAEVKTPHAILTRANLDDYYRRGDAGWTFSPAPHLAELAASPPEAGPPRARGRRPRIGFVPHYPAHDWYRNMRRAMQHRADALGMELVVAAPQAGIAHEIRGIRRMIARAAAAEVKPGDTILVNHGEVSLFLAEELRTASDITLVTNSLDVLERLSGQNGLKVILTSGELHVKARCLVGPSLGALFETLRVDKAFLAVDGISARFGPSASDERMALAARRFADASREVHVMADHSLVGQDANHRIVALDRIDELITDSGSLPADRLAFASAGTQITIADEETGTEERPAFRPAGPLQDPRRPEAIA